MAKPSNAKRQRAKPQTGLWEWLDDFGAVSKCMNKHGLEELLDEGGGIAFIPNLLPLHIAEQLLQHLQVWWSGCQCWG
jgi:hypothetical protein